MMKTNPDQALTIDPRSRGLYRRATVFFAVFAHGGNFT
jgi:hypothetical protein